MNFAISVESLLSLITTSSSANIFISSESFLIIKSPLVFCIELFVPSWNISISPPVPRVIFWLSGNVIPCEKSNSSLVVFHNIVASVLALTASCIVIPAPFALPEVSFEA